MWSWAHVGEGEKNQVKTFKFTEGRIEGLQPRAKGEATYRDTAVPGLELRVLASGARAYCVRYRLGGRGSPQRRLTLGAAGEMRLDEARKAALKALAEVRHGGDPVAERKAVMEARAEAAARTAVAELVDLHEAEQRARGVASAADAAKMLRRDFVAAVGKGRDPATVSRAELVRLFDRVREGVSGHDAPRPGSVSTFRARLHGLFETALARGIVQANPLAGYRQPRATKTERIARAERRAGRMLRMDEIATLWVACGDERVSQSFGAYIQTLIVTGCRRGELAAARLSWIKAATRDRVAFMTIPAAVTKAGREHVIPLPPLAAAVIAGVRRYADTDFLFPGRRTGRTAVSISGWSKLWPALLAVARDYGVTGSLTIHDLRKSARSHWGRLGVSDRVTEVLLNHTVPNILIDIYDRRQFLDEKIAAMDLWSREIKEALEVRQSPSVDVVTLPHDRKGMAKIMGSRPM
jgi:integrase